MSHEEADPLNSDRCGGGFSGTALAGENIAMGDAGSGDGIFQRRPDMLLANELIKCLGAVFAGYDLVHAR